MADCCSVEHPHRDAPPDDGGEHWLAVAGTWKPRRRSVWCLLGFHRFVGADVPHTYRCARPGCPATEAGYP